MINIVLLGKNGQVASAIRRYFSDFLDANLIVLGSEQIDLTKAQDWHAVMSDYCPHWIINATAYTAVDAAEQDVDICHQINHQSIADLAKHCAQHAIKLVHYSTDYVFDGKAQSPYKENDAVNPQTQYGRSKLFAEQAILESGADSIILRTSWVYDAYGKNFVNTMLRLAMERDELNVVADQIGSPTWADDLAQVTLQIIAKIENGAPFVGGVFHASGAGQTSWFDFCRAIISQSGHENVTVNAIKTEDFPTPAKRPRYSVLDNTKLHETYNILLDSWQQSLAKCLAQKAT